MIQPGRRKWLAEQLHRLADEEERKGLEVVALQLRESARQLEADLDPATKPKSEGRPIVFTRRRKRNG